MRVLAVPGVGTEAYVDDLRFSPDGRRLAAAVRGWGVFLADLTGGDFRSLPGLQAEIVDGLAFHPAGRVSWVVLDGSGYRRYESDAGGRPCDPPPGLGSERVQAQVSCGAAGPLVAVTLNPHARRYGHGGRPARSGYRLRAWQPTIDGWAEGWMVKLDAVECGSRLGGTPGRVFLAERPATSPGSHEGDGELVCRAAADGAVLARTRNPLNWEEAWPVPTPDGTAAVIHSTDQVMLWRPGEDARVAIERPGLFGAAAFHPSGAYLALTHYRRTLNSVLVYDTASWVEVRRYDWGVGSVCAVAFSPNGQLGAAGTADGRVVLWDADD